MANIKINIKDLAIYLPKKTAKNTDLDKIFNQKKNTFFEKTGIKRRKISSAKETAEFMATKAAIKLLKRNAKANITHIISVSNTSGVMFPNLAHFILSGINKYLKTIPFCIPLSVGCSGFIDALILSNVIISKNRNSKILIVTCDTYSKRISSSDKSILPVFGDGASACLVKYDSKGWAIEKEFSENLPFTEKKIICDESMGYKMIMKGPEVINFAISSVLPNILKMVKKEKEIVLFSHQASKIVLDIIKKNVLKINKNVKIPLFYENVGNLASTSIPLLISKNLSLFKKSKKILLAGFGVGLTHSYVKLKK